MNLRSSVLSSPRRHHLAAAFILAVAVLGALAVAGWLAHWPSDVFGGSASASAPAGAVTSVTDLTARNPATLRAALVTGYPIKAGDVAPAGTSIRVQPGTWRQQGDYAIVQAVLTLPGRAPLTETVYLVREEGRWLVLFADPS
jgi:membrane-associated phospholipid phosphatase